MAESPQVTAEEKEETAFRLLQRKIREQMREFRRGRIREHNGFYDLAPPWHLKAFTNRSMPREEKPLIIYNPDRVPTTPDHEAGANKDIRLGRMNIPEPFPQQKNRETWEKARYAIEDLARRVGKDQARPIRFVKILGSGGNGFVCLLASDTHFYVCKGVKDEEMTRMISPFRTDNLAVEHRKRYNANTARLHREALIGVNLSGALHMVQTYYRAYKRQMHRLRLNLTTRAVAARIDQDSYIARFLNRTTQEGERKLGAVLLNATTAEDFAELAQKPLKPPEEKGKPRSLLPELPPLPPTGPPPPVPPVEPTRPPLPFVEPNHTYEGIGVDQDLLFLEYHARGDLEKLIGTLTRRNNDQPEAPPNRVLWLIWGCFIKMLRPLDNVPYKRRHRTKIDMYGPLESERYPGPGEPESYKGAENLIHFDIDPKNILVGPFDCSGVLENCLPPDPTPPPKADGSPYTPEEEETARAVDPPGTIVPAVPYPTAGQRTDGHGYFPLLKLADFGDTDVWIMARKDLEWDPKSRTRARNIINTQRKGKWRYKTPEQFSDEWEWVDEEPVTREEFQRRQALGPEKVRPVDVPWYRKPNGGLPPGTITKVAGQYTWKTNLFQLAQTMFCIITGHDPPNGPVATKIRKSTKFPPHQLPQELVNQLEPEKAAQMLANLAEVNQSLGYSREIWSYGGFLLEDAYPGMEKVDRELRETIALCLAAKPADRPERDDLKIQYEERMAYYVARHTAHERNLPWIDHPDHWKYRPKPYTNINDAPSEVRSPDLDTIRTWSDNAFGNPPVPRLTPVVDYQKWLDGIVKHEVESYGPDGKKWWPGDYEYTVDLKRLPHV